MSNIISKFREIAESWIRAYHPTEQQQILAEHRYNVCSKCDYFGSKQPITGLEYCKDCLCPLNKKIFSPEFDACSRHYWAEVDKEYYSGIATIQKKTRKTII